jgi:hypothetical protein
MRMSRSTVRNGKFICDRNGVIDKSELRNLLEAVSSSGEASTAQGWAAAGMHVRMQVLPPSEN